MKYLGEGFKENHGYGFRRLNGSKFCVMSSTQKALQDGPVDRRVGSEGVCCDPGTYLEQKDTY